MSFAKLRKNIEDVFPKRPVPEYKLSNAIIDDDFGDTAYTFKENWKTWDEIEDWQVARCDVLFAFASAEVAVYYTGRYMFYVLDDIDGIVDQKDYGWGSGSGECLVWFLQAAKKINYTGKAYNKEQIPVIEEFLIAIASDDEYHLTLEVGEN